MPPRTVTANSHNHTVGNGHDNNKQVASKGPRDQARVKQEDPKVEEAAPPSGPIIKAQITNATKTSSGKSFLDVLRVGANKRVNNNNNANDNNNNNTTAVVEQPASQPATAVVEPQAAAPEPVAVPAEDLVVETVAVEVEAAPAVENPPQIAEELQVIVHKSTTPTVSPPQQEEQPQPQHPVTLPEADAHFSWANDDDYTFMNPITQTQPEATVQPAAPVYIVQYPESVVAAQQKKTQVTFKAPVESQTLATAIAAMEKERCELDESRRKFEDYCKQREMELNEKFSKLSTFERQLQDKSDRIKQECANIIEQQQQLQQQQQQFQQQQQQQQQHHPQPTPARNLPAAPPVSAPHGQHSAHSYTTYNHGMQDNMGWHPSARQENWHINQAQVVPPYENRFQGGPGLQQPRGKPFGGRGGDGAPHMNRGNGPRLNPHGHNNFHNRQMVPGNMRGSVSDNGMNNIFNPHSHLGYMPTNNLNQW